jgi:hypothetical protein
MPYAEAERNLRCFAGEVMPELKKWDAGALSEPAELALSARPA